MTFIFGKNPDWWKLTTWLLVILMCALIWCLTSCNPYKNIAPSKRPPETTQDSINLSGRCSATFPQKKPVIIPSKPIITVVTKKDTTQANKLQKTIDSLLDVNNVLFGLMDSVKIVNVDSLKRAIRNSIVNDCNPFEDDTTYTIHDTSYIYADSAMVYNLMNANGTQLNKITILTTQLSDTKSDKDRYFWLFIIATVGFVGSSFFAIKKTFFA